MATIEVTHENTYFIKGFIENEDSKGIECLSNINFCEKETFNEVLKLGFDPNKWEKQNPYSIILVEGKPYTHIT